MQMRNRGQLWENFPPWCSHMWNWSGFHMWMHYKLNGMFKCVRPLDMNTEEIGWNESDILDDVRVFWFHNSAVNSWDYLDVDFLVNYWLEWRERVTHSVHGTCRIVVKTLASELGLLDSSRRKCYSAITTSATCPVYLEASFISMLTSLFPSSLLPLDPPTSLDRANGERVAFTLSLHSPRWKHFIYIFKSSSTFPLFLLLSRTFY